MVFLDKKPKFEERKTETRSKPFKEDTPARKEVKDKVKLDERKVTNKQKPIMEKADSVEKPVKIMKRDDSKIKESVKTNNQNKGKRTSVIFQLHLENERTIEKPKESIAKNKIIDETIESNKSDENKKATNDKPSAQPRRNKVRI